MLTCGDYSDYSVVGIFSTKKKAEEYTQAFPLSYGGYHEIEEVDIDPGDTSFYKEGKKVFYLVMDRDGNTSEIKNTMGSTCTEQEYYAHVAPYQTMNNLCLFLTCWAKDETHAVKIANDVRRQKIAEGKWKWPSE